jgi:hypothetical protein
MLRFIDQDGPELPGFNNAPAVNTGKLEQNLGDVAGPWAGKPGQFANSWLPLNALDAVTKAGANPLTLSQGNPNDIRLIAKYYKANPQVANQYDMATNFFLRYIAGVGTQGLQLGQKDGQNIYKMIKGSHEPIRGCKASMKPDASDPLSQLYVHYTDKGDSGGLARLAKGHVPVRYNYSQGGYQPDVGRGQNNPLANSLGQFWAEPQKDGSYIVSDKYDFKWAPGSKGGTDTKTNQRLNKAFTSGEAGFSLDPKRAGSRMAATGHGTPFSIRFQVFPDGRIKILGTPNTLSDLQLKKK